MCLFFGLLLAVLCGVYLSLSRSPEPTVPPGLSGDTTPPTISNGTELPPIGSGPEANGIPGLPSQPPPINTPPVDSGGMAPPFRPQVAAGPPGMAPPFKSDNSADSLPPPPADPPRGRNYDVGGGDPPRPPTTPPAFPSPPANASPPANFGLSTSLERIMQQVKLQVQENKIALALLNLSQIYGSPDLPPSQAQAITQLLDQMAAKVIYSREHLLEGPYRVGGADTLDSIADNYKVPALLLARINGIRDPRNLPPGKELKVLKGPFWAQISTDRSEMTMWLDGRYAGRFDVKLSNDLNAHGPVYGPRKSPPPAPSDSRFNKQWIELVNPNGNISMQGTSDTRDTTGRESRSTIWLSEQDMDDVSGILSVGSRVIIQR